MSPLASRKAKRALATVLSLTAGLMVAGAAGLVGYPFYTDLRASRQQDTLAAEFASSPEIKAAYQDPQNPERRKVKLADGQPLTRIIISKLRVDTVVVEGTSLRALAAGAGHYIDTPLPGEPGNVAIAGHRTMNGKPFENLDRLSPGDKVILITPFARHTYEVVTPFEGHQNPWVTTPNDWKVAAPTRDSVLTLTTCHPKGSARERLVARAKLLSSEPLTKS
ncbi:MAG: sortase [Actinomycetota bacterium]